MKASERPSVAAPDCHGYNGQGREVLDVPALTSREPAKTVFAEARQDEVEMETTIELDRYVRQMVFAHVGEAGQR